MPRGEHFRPTLTTLVQVISLPLWPITWKSLACTADRLRSLCHVEWRPATRPLGGARFIIFGGDPIVGMLREPKIVVNHHRCDTRYRVNPCMVVYSPGSSDLQRNEGLLISGSVVKNCGVSPHVWSMRPTRTLWNIYLNHTHPAFLWYMRQFRY